MHLGVAGIAATAAGVDCLNWAESGTFKQLMRPRTQFNYPWVHDYIQYHLSYYVCGCRLAKPLCTRGCFLTPRTQVKPSGRLPFQRFRHIILGYSWLACRPRMWMPWRLSFKLWCRTMRPNDFSHTQLENVIWGKSIVSKKWSVCWCQ